MNNVNRMGLKYCSEVPWGGGGCSAVSELRSVVMKVLLGDSKRCNYVLVGSVRVSHQTVKERELVTTTTDCLHLLGAGVCMCVCVCVCDSLTHGSREHTHTHTHTRDLCQPTCAHRRKNDRHVTDQLILSKLIEQDLRCLGCNYDNLMNYKHHNNVQEEDSD